MNLCRKCKSTDIRSRRNFSHGRKSKATTTLSCRKCGSSDIERKTADWRGKRKRR